METIVFLVVGILFVLIVWLISHAIRSTSALDAMERRLDRSDRAIGALKEELRVLNTAFIHSQASARTSEMPAATSPAPTAAEKLLAAISSQPVPAAVTACR